MLEYSVNTFMIAIIWHQCYKTFFSVIYTIASVKILVKFADRGVNYAEKSFKTLTLVANIIKLFTSVIYEFSYSARTFVPGKLFKPGLTNILAY
jgi:hypothetical protein